MAIVTLPDCGIMTVAWTMPEPLAFAITSPWTQDEEVADTGRWSPWMAQFEVTPQNRDDIIEWLGFKATCRGVLDSFRAEAVERPQHTDRPTVRAAGAAAAGATTLALDGLTPYARQLRKGQLITVVLADDSEQLIPLADDLVASSTGAGVATLGVPLRRAVDNDAAVETRTPWAMLSIRGARGWSVSPGQIYQPFGFAAREVF